MILMDGLYDLFELDGKEHDGVLFLRMFKSKAQERNRLSRGVRKIWLSSALPGKSFWLGDWYSRIDGYDTVVLSDYSNSPSVSRYIHQSHPNIRVIIWYHNPVDITVPLDSFDRSYCELWSFDPGDCERYGLSYNPQFYIPSKKWCSGDITCDAFYAGREKGRGSTLQEMQVGLESLGYKTEFDIVGYNSEPLAYETILEKIKGSRIIVDCQSPWQSGMTLRPLEALFYKRKLITNSKHIKQMDFYRPENIFVWGDDPITTLGSFIDSPMVDIDESIRDAYTLSGWLKRFR